MLSARLLALSFHDDDLRCVLVLESQYGGLLCAFDFLFEQFRICFYYSCSVGLLPDWVFQNYVAHGVPSRPTNPARWATRSPAVSLQEQSYIVLFNARGIRCQKLCVSARSEN